MSQVAAKKDPISELSDVTLKGVVVLNVELGCGAYGSMFTVKHNGIVHTAKKIDSLLLENVNNEVKQQIKDDFVQECLCCSSI